MKTVLVAVTIVLLLGTMAYAEMFTARLPWPEAGEEVDLMQLQAEVLKKVPSLEPVFVGFATNRKGLRILTKDRELTKDERKKVNTAVLIHMPGEPVPKKTLRELIAIGVQEALVEIDMDKLLRIIEVYGD